MAILCLVGLFGLLGWSLQNQPDGAGIPAPRSFAQDEEEEEEEPETFFEFVTFADGTQVVDAEPCDESVTAEAEIGLDTLTNTFDLAIEFTGLVKEDITALEIRQGAIGVNGALIVALNLNKLEGGIDEETLLPFLEFSDAMQPFPPANVEHLFNGETYLLVTTTDGCQIRGQFLPEVDVPGEFDLRGLPGPLSSIEVPEADLDEFVKDEDALLKLGKVLFWEMQAGSDGIQACATCHFHAGADVRDINAIGLPPNPPDGINPRINLKTRENWFPFHKLADPEDRDTVIADTAEIHGSAGVVATNFLGIRINSRVEIGEPTPDKNVFTIFRQVEPRNTPTIINAIFKDRVFWDGRANRFFNGVNPFGADDPNAKVWYHDAVDGLVQRQICVDNGALASQAVGPPLSDFEMSFLGRRFPEIGRKLNYLRPLTTQLVHPNDSVLGPCANPNGRGLQVGIRLKDLIKAAFKNRWWNYPGFVDGEFNQMEANFSLFWGLSIMKYESTLVSDQTRFDKFAADWHGDLSTEEDDGIIDDPANDLTDEEKEGAELFLKQGRCIECHGGPTFTAAAIHLVRAMPIEDMSMEHLSDASYDNGFYNIGVRPAAEDMGVGANGPFGPLSIAKRQQLGFPVKRAPEDPPLQEVPLDRHLAIKGAFQVQTLRNIELTGPFMHNGGQSTLEQVVEFYARGTDFFDEEFNEDLDPDVGGIGKVRGHPERIAAMVAFMKTLTDERVRFKKAPFDHPEIRVPNGHFADGRDKFVRINETGADGGAPLKSFIENLQAGGFTEVPH